MTSRWRYYLGGGGGYVEIVCIKLMGNRENTKFAFLDQVRATAAHHGCLNYTHESE